jgi:putative FmdB family regulatory protein
MPLYEYECEHCGTRFERFQAIQDEPIRQCPECAGSVYKVFHAAGIIFKGSGWYITDSRKTTASAPNAVPGDTKPASTESKEEKPAATKAKAEKTETK